MAFYDHIAKQWHATTGFRGGALKQFVLNDLLLDAIQQIENRSILEIGAGNGYFLPLVLRRYSGQMPQKILISDHAEEQLALAKKYCRVQNAEYAIIDARRQFPCHTSSFDLLIATMVFNEIPKRSVKTAIQECYRVLKHKGQFLATVMHPDFVTSLKKRGELRRERNGILTMPGSNSLRLPVQETKKAFYETCLHQAGFEFSKIEVFANEKVYHNKPGLTKMSEVPLALVFNCTSLKP